MRLYPSPNMHKGEALGLPFTPGTPGATDGVQWEESGKARQSFSSHSYTYLLLQLAL